MENITQISSIIIETANYNKPEYSTPDDWKSKLLSVVESSNDLDAFSEMTDEWVQKYHLSPKRERLLSWFDFSGVDRILEIGSGCGALTGLLSKNCNFLVAVDESFRRTQINATINTVIGDDFLCGANTHITDNSNHKIFDMTTGERISVAKRPITIGQHVWLGLGTSILKEVNIGHNSVIGARSVVTKDVPSHCIAVGNPAKVIKENIDWKV
jgi:acetyltransferase-like isoleucine patch superfamily enzyme